MSNQLSPEQQSFFEELLEFEIPDSIAVIIALKTNWSEIRTWDERRELRLLATIIWQTGIIESMAESMKMARKIKKKGLDKIYKEPRSKRQTNK